jgi:hypothetical protein
MQGLAKLTRLEAKVLFLRDPVVLLVALAVPVGILLAQGLTGIITQVQAARHAEGRPDDWRRHLDNAADLARESLAEARRTVEAVGPEPLEGAGLPDALADVVARWSELHGVRTEVPRPAPSVRCTRRSRWRCSAPPRRPWPTWPSTAPPRGSG